MCGIIGVASSVPIPDRTWLATGRDTMRHRGPDGRGEWWAADGRAGLGHRRLAIIDLSAAGHQPMTDLHGDLHVTFNGEIYNFRDLRRELTGKGYTFRSNSDTEVVLAAYREWGTECLARLNGMFALALYDERCRQLFLARDRAGEKPLFYSLDSPTLRFASELKALMADPAIPRRLDRDAMDCYLAMGFVPGERCILKGIKKLPPAHALVFDVMRGEARVWRYWRLPQEPLASAAAGVCEPALVDELEALLQDSVRRQLVADVPVGVLLSGGVDSSLVTAMAARVTPKINTFTVRFPGHGCYDETEHARLMARHFSTQHVELDAGELSVDVLPVLARQFDEPIVDSSMIPTYLLARVVRGYCTVALGGDGGDELFGGYQHYSRLLWVRQKLSGFPPGLLRLLATGGNALLPLGFKGRNWLQGLETDLETGLPLIASYFDSTSRSALMSVLDTRQHETENFRQQRIPRMQGLLQRATRMDFENYLPEDILVKVDRASMLNSLEVRAPMLDYRLIEFAFGRVPPDLRATASARKVLLKKLAARLLPPQFDQSRKQGFSIPLAAWLRAGPWRAYFREVLLDSNDGPFDRKAICELLEGQAQGLQNSERLFALTLFQLWRTEYAVAV